MALPTIASEAVAYSNASFALAHTPYFLLADCHEKAFFSGVLHVLGICIVILFRPKTSQGGKNTPIPSGLNLAYQNVLFVANPSFFCHVFRER